VYSVDLVHAIAALLWPVVVAGVLVFLLPVVLRLMKSSQSVDIEVAGTKLSIQGANEAIRKQIADLQDRVNALEAPPADRSASYEVPPAPPGAQKILWVDDRPNANVYERARVMDAGYRLFQADATPAALRLLASDGPFEVIISDMSRVEAGGKYKTTAGLDLVKALRASGDQTRVVFYSSSKSLTPVMAELRQIPNVASTTSPTELMYLLGISNPST
jgi:CheY-like chemotaxis protein